VLVPAPALAGGGPNGPALHRRWLIHDHLGSAVLAVGPDGTAVQQRLFEPFGAVIGASPSSGGEATAQLFTGQRYQAVAGLYDFKARWYDPVTGRFLSVDPIVQSPGDPQTHNAYSYVRNNPVSHVDPDGLSFGKWLQRLGKKIGKFFQQYGPAIAGVLLIVVGVVLSATGHEYAGPLLVKSGYSLLVADAVGKAGRAVYGTAADAASRGGGGSSFSGLAPVAAAQQAAPDVPERQRSQGRAWWQIRVGPESGVSDIGIKTGVDIGYVEQALRETYPSIVDAWKEFGGPRPVITAGDDGIHRGSRRPGTDCSTIESCRATSDSLHYRVPTGAIDLRANNISDAAADAIARSLQRRLDAIGPGYFVQHERFPDPVNDHIHVQFGPAGR